jgi:aerobic-type carbon monoxide dehydrogenase small subunit (CoxS/CutS family)
VTTFVTYQLEINGHSQVFTTQPGVTLMRLLRETLGLTGTKFNCEQGECGACTVLLDGHAVDSCLVLAVSVEGRSVTTIEGLSDPDRPDPIQEAFLRCDALQCGYCTPGMILASKSYLTWAESPTPAGLAVGLSGNYCRCTGYEAIVEALTGVMDGPANRHE